MGIKIVQKSNLNRPKKDPKIALVLSGGAVSGGAFKLGGLQALNNFMENRKINDFDMFMGVSAGSLLATYIANGVTTNQLARSMEGKRSRVNPIMLSEFYSLNYKDIISTPTHIIEHIATMILKGVFDFLKTNNIFRKDFRKLLFNMAAKPNHKNVLRFVKYCLQLNMPDEHKPSLPWHFIPNGIFKTDKFERSTRKNLEKNHLYNDFKDLYEKRGKSLYIVSMKLDSAEQAVFGPDEDCSIPISKAMQTSIALPLFYKPVTINNVDYVDGAIIKTTGIDIAIAKGADLIICYNPFRPFNLDSYTRQHHGKQKRIRIAEDGIYAVLNQVIRTLLHTRLMNGMKLYEKNPEFTGDIILVEPTEYDAKFFDMNPISFWDRRKAAKRGYQSVQESIGDQYEPLKKILNVHGIMVNSDFSASHDGYGARHGDPVSAPALSRYDRVPVSSQ